MKINESEVEVVINHQDHASTGLAIDDVSRLMFFFEKVGANNYSLVVSDMDGKNEKSLLLNLKDPQDIEYYDGYVFYSDLGSQIIGRINSDGSELLTLTGSINAPLKATGLAIDSIEKRLYWCDRERHLIESSDFNFSQRRNIIQKTYYFRSSFWLVTDLGQVLDPFDLTIHQENIFWTDLKKQAIFVADKRSGDNIEYVTGGLNEPRGIFVTGDMFHEGIFVNCSERLSCIAINFFFFLYIYFLSLFNFCCYLFCSLVIIFLFNIVFDVSDDYIFSLKFLKPLFELFQVNRKSFWLSFV